MFEEGPVRKKFREFLSSRPLLSPVTAIYPPGVDSEIDRKREAKRQEWLKKGYPPALIDKALILSDRWVSSLADAFGAGDPKVRDAIIRGSYDKALSVGENWILAMMK